MLLCAGLAWASLDGTYHGEINATPSVLRLTVEQGRLTGAIDTRGYKYLLHGTAENETALATLTDPTTGGSGQFEARKQGDAIQLKILMAGQPPLVLRFSGKGGEPTGRTRSGFEAGAEGIERDPPLIGRWRHTESMTSGTFSGVAQTFLTIFPDGSYQYGEGTFAGGGPGVSGSSRGGDVTSGEWRTEDRVVYIREPSRPQWKPYARYYVEGNKMLLTFGDGSRQIWYRVN